jgi:ATP-dependent protease ClpP protease subunit
MTAVLYLYDDITSAAADAFLSDLKAVPASSPVTVAINSRGGNVLAGDRIFAAIRRHRGETTARIDGLAASAASYIAMATDRVIMTKGAFMMIHNPGVEMIGTAAQLENMLVSLREVEAQYSAEYARKTGETPAAMQRLMDAETWMSAAQAVAMNFADEVDELVPTAKTLRGALDAFHHVPAAVRSMAARANQPPRPPRTRAQRARYKKRMALLANFRLHAMAPGDRDALRRAADRAQLTLKHRARMIEEARERVEQGVAEHMARQRGEAGDG